MKNKKVSDWKNELARDFLALGSWVFFILVVVRILILPYRWPYLTHLLVAGGLILLVDIFARKKVDGYVARAIIIVYYTSIFYEDNLYSIVTKLVLAGILFSSYYVDRDWKKIVFGIVLGLIGVGLRFIL